MKSLAGFLSILFVLLMGAPALANQLREYSHAEKVEASSLIVIGTVMTYHDNGYLGPACASVKVKSVLKGTVGDQLEVDTSGGGISEQSVNGLQIGSDYVFYLMQADGTKFISVNGQFGVMPVSVFKP